MSCLVDELSRFHYYKYTFFPDTTVLRNALGLEHYIHPKPFKQFCVQSSSCLTINISLAFIFSGIKINGRPRRSIIELGDLISKYGGPGCYFRFNSVRYKCIISDISGLKLGYFNMTYISPHTFLKAVAHFRTSANEINYNTSSLWLITLSNQGHGHSGKPAFSDIFCCYNSS